MRVLITGGAGFIGSHLAESHLRRGDSVTVLDDLSTGSLTNLRAIAHADGFRCTVGRVEHMETAAPLVESADLVYHLAAAVGVRLIVERPVHTIETNILGTRTILEAAARTGSRVIVASTSEVYGKSLELPFREDADLLLGPSTRSRWSYAASKLVDEFLTLAYCKERALPGIVVRLFNTVGPRQTGRYGMVIPNFVRQALDGSPLTVHGDGQQSRCFCHVEDVCDALTGLAGKTEAVGQVFNVGSSEEVTMEQLAGRVRLLTDSDSPIEYVPYERAYEAGFEDMRRRVPDTTKVTALTGWRPRHDLDAMLRSVIEFERARTAA